MDILRDKGTGSSDGFSVNVIFVQGGQEPVVQNIEVAPGLTDESVIDVFGVQNGTSYAHCNRFQHFHFLILCNFKVHSVIQDSRCHV